MSHSVLMELPKGVVLGRFEKFQKLAFFGSF